jgi:DNA-binding transcriptional MerR regulator
MLRIGEFSRLSQVTVKTLRHYDDIGLLKPSHVDPFSDYRYYTLDQLPRLHSIMALKSMGLSLEEIAQLLLEDLPPEQIRGMFRLKQTETQRRVHEEQARLAQIEFRLRQIEMVGSMHSVDIVIKRIDPFYALTLRRIAHNRQERHVVAEPIATAIQRGAIKPSGAPRFNVFYEEEFHGEYDDYEIGIPVHATHSPQVPLPGVGTLQLRELPAIEAAATYLHQGDYDTLNEKYVFLQRWAVENGYKLGAVWRFVWHRGPMHDVDPSTYLTELQHPIEPA